jgi:hypothetical protein
LGRGIISPQFRNQEEGDNAGGVGARGELAEVAGHKYCAVAVMEVQKMYVAVIVQVCFAVAAAVVAVVIAVKVLIYQQIQA